MLSLYKSLVASQFEAVFTTLATCLDRCPPDGWHAPVANRDFSQVAFHAVYYTDLYLSADKPDFFAQQFHHEHADHFQNYQESEDEPPRLKYERDFVTTYLAFTRTKAATVIAAETEKSLAAITGFYWLPFSRAELHPYNIRHTQHHTSHLALRLRLDHVIDIPWTRSGHPAPRDA